MRNVKDKLKQIFLTNTSLKFFAVLLAFVVYVAMTMFVNPIKEVTIKNVPIIVDKQSAIITKQGLNLLSEDVAVADVKVSGESYIVANLTDRDIGLTASLGNVSGAGSYDLTLEPVNKSGKEFTFVSVSPKMVKVKFDKLLERKYPVTPEITNFTVPDGYIRLEDPLITPSEVTIKGPEVELDKISKVKVIADLENKPLNKTTTLTLPIQLFDKNDDPIAPPGLTLEAETADVKLTIYKNKQIPLTIDFTNVPANFPVEELYYTISNPSIWVAGPTDQIDNLTGINVGYIDLKTLTPDNNVFNFDVTLPSNFSNVEHIETVAVEFDLGELTEKSFFVNNLKILNTPIGTDASLLTKQINNVTVVGSKAVLASLTAKDIIGEIDLSDRKITTGQIEMPVSIIVPGKGLVWATGDYSAVVNIREK